MTPTEYLAIIFNEVRATESQQEKQRELEIRAKIDQTCESKKYFEALARQNPTKRV